MWPHPQPLTGTLFISRPAWNRRKLQFISGFGKLLLVTDNSYSLELLFYNSSEHEDSQTESADLRSVWVKAMKINMLISFISISLHINDSQWSIQIRSDVSAWIFMTSAHRGPQGTSSRARWYLLIQRYTKKNCRNLRKPCEEEEITTVSSTVWLQQPGVNEVFLFLCQLLCQVYFLPQFFWFYTNFQVCRQIASTEVFWFSNLMLGFLHVRIL